MADTTCVHRAERFKQLFDHEYYMLLRVPIYFKHVVFQIAQLSSFLQDVKEQIVIDYVRRSNNVRVINGTQRVHFAPLDILFRLCTSV